MAAPRFIVWRQRDLGYLVLVAILVFALAALLTLFGVVFTVVTVDGGSMRPALEHSDRLLLTRGYESPRRGDVIAFRVREPDGRSTALIKRVVALPGDTVEIIGDSAWVNGQLSADAPTARVGTGGVRYAPLVVPEGTVYVLGDNRPVSLDSRFIGSIPEGTVIGKAVAVILPVTRMRGID